MKKKLLAAAAAIAVIGLLGGCAGGSDASGESGGEGSSGGTLIIGMNASTAESLDPHYTKASSSDLLRAAQLFDGLTRYTREGTVEPALVEEFIPNEDSTEWTVKLREGVKFHDGTDFTADDVIFSIARILDPNEAARGAGQLAFMTADQVSKVDDHTLLFELDSPYGPFDEVWASNYLRIVPEGFDPQNPIGTGAFVYESFTSGQESTFVRNDDYWDTPAHIDAVQVQGFADNDAAINALIAGQIDIAYSVPQSQIPVLEATPGVELLENESGMYFPIVMNQDAPPFDDERVRLALKLIADRSELVDNALNGAGRVANDFIANVPSCPAPDIPQREQDIPQAQALLAEAGYENLEIDLYASPGTAGMVESAVVYAEQAREAGVTVNVHQLDEASFVEKYTEWPMSVDFYSSPYLELVPLTLLPGGPGNAGHWNDAEFVQLSADLFATSDPDERCGIIAQMQQIEHDRGVNIVWGWVNVYNAHSDRVKGLLPDVAAKAPFFLRDITLEG